MSRFDTTNQAEPSRGDRVARRWEYRGGRVSSGGVTHRRDVMCDVSLFEGDQRRVEHGVHRKMLLAPAQPGGGVVDSAQRCDGERHRMDAEFQLLAVAALQDLYVQGHATSRCKAR